MCCVVFDDDNIVHVDGSVDPIRDKEVIDYELQLKDLETVENKINSLKRAVKSGDKDLVKQYEFCEKLKTELEAGQSARVVVPEGDAEEAVSKDLQLLDS